MHDETKTPAALAIPPAVTMLRDLVLIEPVEGTGTVGKLVIPEANTSWIRRARVVAVGEGLLTPMGQRVPLSVKPGDIILHRKLSDEVARLCTVRLGDKTYTLLKADDLVGIVPA